MPRMTRLEKKIQTRNKLVEAAKVEFSNSGFYGCSVDTIAETAGFSKGAFYSHFKTKEDIFLVLLEDHMSEEAQQISSVLNSTTNELEDIVSSLLDSQAESPENNQWKFLCIELALFAHRNSEFGSKYTALQESHTKKLCELIETYFQNMGINPPVEAKLLAEAFISLFLGLKVSCFSSDEDTDERKKSIVKLFVSGLIDK